MSVTFEIDETLDGSPGPGVIGSRRLLGTQSTQVYLNGESAVHINDIDTNEFPTKDDCAAEYKKNNGESVMKSCWKFKDMPHLQVAFPYFQVPTAAYTQTELPDSKVPNCEILKNNRIAFTDRPCKTPDTTDAVYVWIRPSYKFYPGLSGKPGVAGKCAIVTRPPTARIQDYYTSNDNTDHWPKYENHAVAYKPLPNIDGSFVTYDYEGKTFGFNFRAHMKFPCETTSYRMNTFGSGYTYDGKKVVYDQKFAPVNAETSNTQEICPDYVSEACFKNVYSFYGRPCTWADKKKFTFSSLKSEDHMSSTTADDRQVLWRRFREYGKEYFDFDFDNFKLQVRRYNGDIATRISTTKVQIGDNDVIDIAPEDGYSCGGCIDMPGGQGVRINADVDAANTPATQDIPLECKLCLQFESIAPGNFPNLKPYQRCQECERHKTRSPKIQSDCVPCSSMNETRPMRVFKEHKTCMSCMHVQYFDETRDEGCIYYVSVSDFISFGADGLPAFASTQNQPPRDEFSETGVKDKVNSLIVVRPKYYRVLNIASTWKASSNQSACAYNVDEVINSTVSNLTNATRNTEAKRLYYRQWCGHDEIIRQQNALLRKQQISPVQMNSILITLQEMKSNCTGALTALKENAKEVMPDNRIAEFKCENQTHKFLYEIRREGQDVSCTVCPGTSYTKKCWPTYHPSMSTVDDEYFSKVNTPSPGTCDKCVKRCDATDNFLKTSLFSCWSNGTQRISGEDHGRLDYLEKLAALHMNYWYKEADCSTCPRLDGIAVRRPALVTRCGNKVSFDIWHPAEVLYIDGVAQPTVRVCCSLVRFNSGGIFDVNLDAWCFQTHDIAKLNCESTIPDLATETAPYCPPGWFVDETCAKDKENVDVWTPQCCLKCHACSLGLVKTPQYQDCPGDTFYDTQTFGCKAECLSGNYLDGDTCIPCETCMR